MLKHVATVNFALASVFVLPSVAGTQDGTQGLVAQLDATVASLDYLGELMRRVETGEVSVIPLLLGATEPQRQSDLQSEARLVTLRGDVSRLRLALDRILEQTGADPNIPGIPGPGSGAGARSTHVPRTPDNWGNPGALAPTTGLDAGATGDLKSVLPPLQHVDPSAHRRGGEPVVMEDTDYSADAVRQGKLLFRANRHPEAIQLLFAIKPVQGERYWEARYWLAQAYRAMDLEAEALDVLRSIISGSADSAYARHAQTDIEFMEFERKLAARRQAAGSQGK